MEPVRPEVDSFLLDWIARGPLKREWFFEKRDGNCRLLGSFAVRLTETVPMWRRGVAPYAEFVAQTLWSIERNSKIVPATRLTQRRKREAQVGSPFPSSEPVPPRENFCRTCGIVIKAGSMLCRVCAGPAFVDHLVKIGRECRVAAHTAEAQRRRSGTQQRNAEKQRRSSPDSLPGWLSESAYIQKIQPLLAKKTNSAIAVAISCSLHYAIHIRTGRRIPHPRNWETLAKLAGVSENHHRL